jgi:hypothetical protein
VPLLGSWPPRLPHLVVSLAASHSKPRFGGVFLLLSSIEARKCSHLWLTITLHEYRA